MILLLDPKGIKFVDLQNLGFNPLGWSISPVESPLRELNVRPDPIACPRAPAAVPAHVFPARLRGGLNPKPKPKP